MAKEKWRDNSLIDLKAFGEYIHAARRNAGYKSPEQFSAAIQDKTEYLITPKTIYRIEHGETCINLPCVVSISLTLFDEPLSKEIISLIDISVKRTFLKEEIC